jgi:hypothetical protein
VCSALLLAVTLVRLPSTNISRGLQPALPLPPAGPCAASRVSTASDLLLRITARSSLCAVELKEHAGGGPLGKDSPSAAATPPTPTAVTDSCP